MSYARTSEKNSDIYIWGSGEGIHVHVAHNRGSANTVSQPKPGADEEAWKAYFQDVIPFDNPYVGKYYFFTSYSDCLAQLEVLKAAGVGIPKRAFAQMREEAKGGDLYDLLREK